MLTTTKHFTALARNSTFQQLSRAVTTTTGLSSFNNRSATSTRLTPRANVVPPYRFFHSTSRINMPPLPIQKAEEVGE